MTINIKGLELNEGDSFYMVMDAVAQKYTIKQIDGDMLYLSIWLMGETEIGPLSIEMLSDDNKILVRTEEEAKSKIKDFILSDISKSMKELDSIGLTELSKVEWTVLRSFATSLRGILKNMKEGAWDER